MTKIKINSKNKNIRLDKFLAEKFSENSRTFMSKKIKQGLILINGKKKSAHYKLKEDDLVEIHNEEAKKKSSVKKIKAKIIFENADFLIINKPSGIAVHEAPGNKEAVLTDWLVEKYPIIKQIGEDKTRPGIMHRLDKEASGIMVIAKNQKNFFHLKNQFKDRKVEKKYFALCYGNVINDERFITQKIGRSKKSGKIITGQDPSFREAKTFYEIKEKFENFTLLNVKIITGRTHQIRVHLKSIGHPIAGDNLYKLKKVRSSLKFPRIFLHAYKLGFYNLKNEWQEFQCSLPVELKKILKILK